VGVRNLSRFFFFSLLSGWLLLLLLLPVYIYAASIGCT
jgi:hypothetical protein